MLCLSQDFKQFSQDNQINVKLDSLMIFLCTNYLNFPSTFFIRLWTPFNKVVGDWL